MTISLGQVEISSIKLRCACLVVVLFFFFLTGTETQASMAKPGSVRESDGKKKVKAKRGIYQQNGRKERLRKINRILLGLRRER
ncbi:hypothetical protein F4815DRAFT_220706 [Daldinia loculata]|nr:hypothetical protein F4815DRAFT_220706 [Daldinia loculata]